VRGRGQVPRRGLGGEQVEGRRAVRELLAAGRRPVRDVWLSDTLDDSPVVDEIVALADRAGVAVRRVSRARLDAEARTDAPQGVLAHARELAETDLDDLCRPAADGSPPFLLVVDGVTDPHNLGALLRTAELAGATGAIVARHRAAHVTPTVAKAAAGAIEYLPIAVVAGVPGALTELAGRGIWTVGLDAAAEGSVYDLDLADQGVALVVGAEGSGLSRLARARCDVLVAVPQHGRLASLNVAAAAAVAAFEIARRRG
jgi:23S rRNA (guanosine2251-2'-O)-methyltransferase